MSSTAPFAAFYPTLAVAREDIVPTTRGPMLPIYGCVLAQQRLTTDSVGTFTLTLNNVVVGSAIEVQVASTDAGVMNTTAAATTVVLTLSAYTAGSAANDLRIKVRKGSSTAYKPYETLATAFVGSSSIYVSQIPDE